jgi:branched-chain amino acid transport system substrate-binding protein
MKYSLSSLAVLALVLAACAPAAPRKSIQQGPAQSNAPIVAEEQMVTPKGTVPADAKPIKIALLVPLSGESVAIGNAMLDAATMAIFDSYVGMSADQIRAKIILLPKDTGNTPADAAHVTKQAVDQGANFIIGPLFSQSVNLVAPLAKEAGISVLTFSNNRAVAAEGVYTFGFLPEQQVARVAEYAYLHNMQRVAVLAPNDSYGQKVQDALVEEYGKRGGLVSPTEFYAPSPANIDAAVARLAAAYNNVGEERRFQAIFIGDGGYQLKNIITSLKKTNLDLSKIKLLGTGLWDDPDIANIPEMNGAWFSSSPPDSYQNFERHFVAVYGYKPARLASLAYDAVSLVTHLVTNAPETGLTAATLTDPSGYVGPANGLFRLRADGTSERKLAIMEVMPSGFKVIEPAPKAFVK